MKLGRKAGFQKGYLYQQAGKWIARWYLRTAKNKIRRNCRTIGFISEMTEEEARSLLRRMIEIEGHQVSVYDSLLESARLFNPPVFKRQFTKRSAHIKGGIAEMIVASDLLSRGYDVCRPIDQFAPFDLLYMEGTKAVRVEVKVGSVAENGMPICDLSRNIGKFDILAIVSPSGEIHYKSPLQLDLARSLQSTETPINTGVSAI